MRGGNPLDDCSEFDSIPKELIKRALGALMFADLASLLCSVLRAEIALGRTSENKETMQRDGELLLSEKLRLENRRVELEECLLKLRNIPITPSDRVGIGSLVDVYEYENYTRQIYYIAEDCWIHGGERIDLGIYSVIVISADSPVAQALMGRQADEEADCQHPSGTTHFHILAVK